MPNEELKCPYCHRKFHKQLSTLHEDYTFIDKCENCKRYLLVTLHPDGRKPTITEVPKNYRLPEKQSTVEY